MTGEWLSGSLRRITIILMCDVSPRSALDHIQNMWNNHFQFSAPNFYAMNGFPLAPFYIPYPLQQTCQPAPPQNVKIESSEPTYSPTTLKAQSKKEKEAPHSIAENLRNRSTKPHHPKKTVPKVSMQVLKQNSQTKKQKKDRNLPSNICKMLVSFIFQHPTLAHYLGCYSDNDKLMLTRFLKEVRSHVNESQAYVRPALIEQMCQGRILSEQSTKLFRILFKKYMKLEFRMAVSLTKRFKKKEKLAHFRVSRNYLRSFLQKR